MPPVAADRKRSRPFNKSLLAALLLDLFVGFEPTLMDIPDIFPMIYTFFRKINQHDACTSFMLFVEIGA